MRKIVTVSMMAAAALAVSACGKSEPANSDANAMVTEMNASDAMEGTTNDSMTNVDGAMGTTDNMMAGNVADNATAGNSTNAM
ncbi:MAG: hypothetical protein JWL66_2009 [Sphingomonadales bacterium]|jgi:hypothetical protein|nr:hypothetical protein [Sphingomonadales bacterium]